ncbi:hypothetical protein OQY15_18820 [Pedobacter sp. MC2016-15]|uniref:hypothetical protein n=1 Tax=Pedobacter sp. MC2016-15 TaxID=2994473 RepID=UPI002247954B|nr:hypothetical protein [Pedobacter sp. MC2016-15]MCX2481165.1 hypothetical protein [Pedobacter sp. MC2016-15]
MKVITTLAEKDYFLGVAALVNSIVKHGKYVDKIVVGYRGSLPGWLPALTKSAFGQSVVLQSGLELDFVEVQGGLHMVHEKPKWFRYLTEVLEPGADEYFFFDSDIIVMNRMAFFGEWVKEGVALCEDVNYDMSLTHPIRKQWAKLAAENGKVVRNQLSRYYNSGFLGWTKETASFVVEWDECCQILSRISGDMTKFRVNDRTKTVLSANQDSLNVAAMVTDCPISVIGPEAMGFHYGLSLMQHPLGPKPWKRKFGKDFFLGIPVREADVAFWKAVNDGELKPYPSSRIKNRLFVMKFFKFMGRMYSRRQ